MIIRYNRDKDALTVALRPEQSDETFAFEGGDFIAIVDEDDNLVKITIANASRFIAEALAAGVKAEAGQAVQSKKSEMVWYDADSSMISAFGYNEAEQILDVAFHKTGVYRYYEVPKKIFEGLRDASSKGSYLRSMIIDVYDYEKKRGRSR
jgi:tricorn protease-like protein